MKSRKSTLMLICCVLMIFFYCSRQMIDYDYWFHYVTGEWIVQNKSIPDFPIYSWYGKLHGLSWVSHEWLFGLLIYMFSSTFGESLLLILCPAIIALVTVLAFKKNMDMWENHQFLFLFFSLLAAIQAASYSVPRPQLLMYVLFIILLYIVIGDYESPDKKVYYLIPLTVVWVNLHGGSYILVQVTLVILILSQLINLKLWRIQFNKVPYSVTLRRILVLVLSFASVGLNGHGAEMYAYPFINASDSIMLSSITEWHPLVSMNLTWFLISVILSIAFLLLAIIASKNTISPLKLALVCMWIIMSFRSRRFTYQLLLVIIMCIPDYLGAIHDFTIKHIKLTYILIIIGLLSGTVYKMAKIWNNPFDLSEFPSQAYIEKLKSLPKDSKLFNDYNIGGYLTYNHIDTFIDGRADIYSHHNLKDYMLHEYADTRAKEYIIENDFDYMSIPKADALYRQAKYLEGDLLTYMYSDDNFVLYKVNK